MSLSSIISGAFSSVGAIVGKLPVGSTSSGSNGLAGCTAPTAPTAGQLADYPVGTQITIGPCVAQPATAYNHCATVLGSEWGNDTSVSSGAGALLSCTKTNYSGTLASCCNGVAPPPPYSCNPDATPGSSLCAQTMLAQCTGTNLWTSPCMSWGAEDPTDFNAAAAKYCFSGNNMTTDSNCANWALSSSVKGTIDNQMQAFCTANPGNSLCGCINSPITPCPEKYDKNCITGGYLTGTMLSTACPTVMNCNQYVNLSPAAQSVLIDSAINQNCSTTTSGGGTSTVSNSTPVAASTSSLLSSTNLYYFIFLVFIVLLVMSFGGGKGMISGSMEKIKRYILF